MAQENDEVTDAAVRAWDWKALDAHISATLGTFGGDLAHNASALYSRAGREPDYVLTSMSSDVRVTCPADVVARLAADARAAAVWRYVVTHAPSAPIHAFGMTPTLSRYAMHGWDTSAFFGDVARLVARPTAANLAFQRTMRDVVAEFARTGKIGEPQWRTFPESTALLGASGGVEVARHYHAKQCALWLTNGLFSYAWIN